MTHRFTPRLKSIAKWTWIVILAAIFLAWPLNPVVWPNGVSIYCGTGGRGSPETPWQLNFDTNPYPLHPYLCYGYFLTYYEGRILVFSDTLEPRIPSPPPPVFFTGVGWESDNSGWHGNNYVGIGTLKGARYDWPNWVVHKGMFLPLWPVSITAGILCAFSFNRAVRHYRPRNSTLCPTCSYDLRAHSPGANCPECGTPISPAAHKVPS